MSLRTFSRVTETPKKLLGHSVWQTYDLLLGLPTSRSSKLSEDDEERSYSIIMNLIDHSSKDEYRHHLVQLQNNLPRCFKLVIEEIKSELGVENESENSS